MKILLDALQEDAFFTRYAEACDTVGMTYHKIYPIPFSSYVLGLTPIFSEKETNAIITLGNVDIARRFREAIYPKQLDPEAPIPSNDVFMAVKNSVFHDVKAFEQTTALQKGIPMFNGQGFVTSFKNIRVPGELDSPLFVKPVGDEKSFAGRVIFHGDNVQEIMPYLNINDDTKVLVAPFKKAKREFRCMMIGHTYITGSQYMTNGVLDVKKEVPTEVIAMAEHLSHTFMPHDVYVIDIAETGHGALEVMEYNMFNAAGPYACDIPKMLDALKNHLTVDVDQGMSM